ncbi:hypothetical protein QQ056_01075 [Oscillatoria laete-virens NRMC-F 0139]|nr:hypothetical protein [Oscillatoria laete-virens]MDL5052163.1 hypothetical protein [Oscillatoria laete-virens NRMC-F 0139]
MLIDVSDLNTFIGDGDNFEKLIHGLVSDSALNAGLVATDLFWDDRTNTPDGGKDLILTKGLGKTNPWGISDKPSIWSCKSGKDGASVDKFRNEVLGGQKLPSRVDLQAKLQEGYSFVWITVSEVDDSKRLQFEKEAQSLATQLSIDSHQFHFVWKTQIFKMTERFPGCIIKCLPRLNETNENVYSVMEFRAHFGNPWVNFEGRDALKQLIINHLTGSSQNNVLHIAGLSGIGKSRIAWQACSENLLLQNTLYIPQYIKNDKWLRHIERNEHLNARIIIDEVSMIEFSNVVARLNAIGSRVRFITIGPAHRNERSGSRPNELFIVPPPSTDEAVCNVLKPQYPRLPDPVLRSIAKHSAHDLRLALLLAEATSHDPNTFEIPITGLDDVWKRIVNLFKDRCEKLETHKSDYELLTLSVDIGCDGAQVHELEYVANHFSRTFDDLIQIVRDASICGLGNKTNFYFEAIPSALAVWIFQERLWARLKPRISIFLANLPDRLRRKFMERAQQCNDVRIREEVAQELAGFIKSWFGEMGLAKLADRESSLLFQTWAETDPDRGLLLLKQLVCSATPNALEELDGDSDESGYWRGRRQIVWLCEHMACFDEYFWTCEEILFRLAHVETEKQIGNNSTHVWQELFLPMLANTEVPFPKRSELLLERLKNANEVSIEMILSAIRKTLSDPFAGPVLPPLVIGGRVVPKFWNPETYSELWKLQAEIGIGSVEAFKHLPVSLQNHCAKFLIEELQHYVRFKIAPVAKDYLSAQSSAESLRLRLLAQLKKMRGWYTEESTPNSSAALKLVDDWLKELTSSDLGEQTKDATALDYWEHREGLKVTEADVNRVYVDLASKLALQLDTLKSLEPWFSTPDAKSSYSLGFALGETDSTRVNSVVKQWFNENKAEQLVLGYLAGFVKKHGTLSSDWIAVIDTNIESKPLFVTKATATADQSSRGLSRIVNVVEKSLLSASVAFGLLYFWKWKPGETEMKGVIQLLLDGALNKHDTNATKVGFDLMMDWTNHGKSPLPSGLVPFVEEFCELIVFAEAPVDAYDFQSLIKAVQTPTQDLLDTAAALLGSTKRPSIRFSDVVIDILSHFAKSHPQIVMEAIGKQILDSKTQRMFRFLVFRGLFEALPIEVIAAWLNGNGDNYVEYFARHLPSPFVDKDGTPRVPPVTEWILSQYENDDSMFREFLCGRHSMETRWGHPRDWVDGTEAVVSKFENHSLRRIREWVEYERRILRAEIKHDDEQEELDERNS